MARHYHEIRKASEPKVEYGRRISGPKNIDVTIDITTGLR